MSLLKLFKTAKAISSAAVDPTESDDRGKEKPLLVESYSKKPSIGVENWHQLVVLCALADGNVVGWLT